MLLPGNDDRIYRYDPVNRVSLGAYGANESDMIAADNRGVSYAANGLSVHVQSMDYSNGSHIATYSGISTFNALELKDNYFFGITGTSLRRTNISTGTTNALTLAANVAWQSLAVYGSHAIAIGLSSTDTLAFQSVNLNTLTVNAVQVSTATLTSGTNIGKAAVVYNSLTATPTLLFSMAAPASTLYYTRKALNADGSFTGGTSVSGTLAGFATAEFLPNAMAGHGGGGWFYGQDGTSASLARITRADMGPVSLSLGESHTFNAPGGGFNNLAFTSHGANVVAPEPGTMAALGLGVVAVLRRKRK